MRKILMLLLLAFWTLNVLSIPEKHVRVDSLRRILLYSENDSLRAEAAVSLSWYYYRNKPDSVYNYINLAQRFAGNIKTPQRKYKLYSDIAYLYANIGAFDQAAKYYGKVLEIAFKQKDTFLIIRAYGYLAQLYSLSGNYGLSKQSYTKVLSLLDKKKGNSIRDLIYYYMRLGRVYYYLKQEDSAKYFLAKAIKLYENSKDSIDYSKNDIGAAYFYIGDYTKAINYFKQAMQEDTTELRQAIELSNIGETYFYLGKYDQAEKYFKQVVANPEDTVYLEIMRMSYLYLAQIYEKLGRYKDAYYARKKYNEFLQKKIDKEKQQTIANLELRLKLSEKSRLDSLRFAKELEIGRQQLIQKNLQARNQRIITLFVTLILIVSIIFTFLYRKRYVLNKKQKERLKEQSEILTKQKFELELSHRKLQESIEYASRLQNALLPDEQILKKYFKEYFIFFKPRDQMSGDFYWWTEVEDNLILAVGDCTGHGVPGAMISFIGITLLNELVSDKKILEPEKILDELRKGIIKALHQERVSYNIKDGMEVGIIKYNKRDRTLQYSGAYISLYIVRRLGGQKGLVNISNGLVKKEVTEEQTDDYVIYRIRGDRMPIARYFKMNSFTEHGIKLNKGDVIYLFTDGFVDQLGGEKLGKYHQKKFQHFILNMSAYSMHEQKKKLLKELLSWRGDYPQVDDILVVGLKV